MTDYYDEQEVMRHEDREHGLVSMLDSQLKNAIDNTTFYKQHFSQINLDKLTSLDQISNLPLTHKSELQKQQAEQPPFGGMATCQGEQLGNIFSSPGPIYEPSTKRADYWRFARAMFAAGFRRGDVLMNCFSYHLSPAGAMGETGGHALGCSVIPAGVGQTQLQVQTIHDLMPSAYVGTPSFLRIIIEKAEELNLNVGSINNALVSGEAFPPVIRDFFKNNNINAVQAYATADLGLIAYESSQDSGLIIDEGVYVEIVRPGTGESVDDGEVGEVVVTTLNPDYPLIRFATGDLSAVAIGTSPCGRTNTRIKGWMGRADQTAKVRGMFVKPLQVDQIIKQFPEVSRARLVIDWQDQADQMTLYCETVQVDESAKQSIANSIRDICKVRGEVEFVQPGSLKNDGIVIEDIRKYE